MEGATPSPTVPSQDGGARRPGGSAVCRGIERPTTPARSENDTGHQAVLIRRVGLDLAKDQELAPPRKNGTTYYKGVQTEGGYGGVLTEGRHFYNPFFWGLGRSASNSRFPMARSASGSPPTGADLPAGQIARDARTEGHSGRSLQGRSETLYNPVRRPDDRAARPGDRSRRLPRGRYINSRDGLLHGPQPVPGWRRRAGVQKKTIEPGTYPYNPYEKRVSLVDCRLSAVQPGRGAC